MRMPAALVIAAPRSQPLTPPLRSGQLRDLRRTQAAHPSHAPGLEHLLGTRRVPSQSRSAAGF